MFTQRTSWPRHPNRLAVRLDDLRKAGRRLIDLTCSNPTTAGIAYPAEEIREVLSHESILRYTPDPKGMLRAREAVAAYYREREVHVDPAHVIFTSGSSEAYSFLFRLLCEPGDRVLVPTPSYPLFDYLADISDVHPLPYPLSYDGAWHCDAGAPERSADDRTRAIVVVHPNNPTGTFLSTAARDGMARFARSRSMALIVDEVFIDYALGPDALRAPSTAGFDDVLTFTMNGLSKTAGLPQMKLGWIVVSGPPSDVTEALARLEIIADTYLSVNTPVQAALPDLLRLGKEVKSRIQQRIRTNLDAAVHRLKSGSACSLLPVEGGWYLTLHVPATRSEEEWALALLEERGVYVHPGFFFDMPGGGHLVVSLLTPEAEFVEGIEAIASW